MANNLRYLLEHFCLDGQKIDISSQLDEENANNIEKINTQTVPSINARIDDIKNTDIPNINSRIDSIKNTDIPSINQKINTINNTTIPSVQTSVTAVDEKADRINESVTKNTRDIGTLSDNVTMQGNAINSINTEKIPSVENNVEVVAHETQRLAKAHEHDINGINESLSTLHDETSSNTSNIGSLTTNVNELTTKVNTNTDSINTINNTSIPHLQSEIDNLSGGGTGSVGELREKVEKNTSDISELSGKVDTNTTNISALSGKVDTNTANISALSGKVDTNTSAISTINNTSIQNLQSEISSVKEWEQIMNEYHTPKGFVVTAYVIKPLRLIQIFATLSTPQSIEDGEIKESIPNFRFTPDYPVSSAVYIEGHVASSTQGVFTSHPGGTLTLSFKLPTYNFPSTLYGSVLYTYI